MNGGRGPKASKEQRVDPPPELGQHHEIRKTMTTTWDDTGKAERAEATRVVDQTTLDWLRARDLIGMDQHRAGVRFHREWYLAGYDPRQTIPWERDRATGGRAEMPERQAEAMQTVKRIMVRLGLRTAGVVQAICCAGQRIGDVEDEQEITDHQGLTILRCGLDVLAVFFLEIDDDFAGRHDKGS